MSSEPFIMESCMSTSVHMSLSILLVLHFFERLKSARAKTAYLPKESIFIIKTTIKTISVRNYRKLPSVYFDIYRR